MARQFYAFTARPTSAASVPASSAVGSRRRRRLSEADDVERGSPLESVTR
jgi:hypothetical protein